MLVKMWRKENICALLVSMWTDAATMENRTDIPQILETDLLCDLAIPLQCIYPKKMTTQTQKEICTHFVHCSIIYSSQDMEKPKCLSMVWDFTYTKRNLISYPKKKEIPPFVTRMDLKDILLSWNESNRETQLPYDTTWRKNLKTKQNWTQRYKEQTVQRQTVGFKK